MAVMLLAGACDSDERGAPGETSTSVVGTQAEQFAVQLDCIEATSAEDVFSNARWPFTESIDCWMDGRPSIRIHSFDAASASEVARGFEQRYGVGTTNGCPSGEAFASQFIVLGETWAVVTTRPALRDLVLERLGGVALQSDDNSTPVSYPAVDPCPDSPPISEPG